MSKEEKEIIKETVENLRHLDRESLMIIKSGSEMLKARDALAREQKNGKERMESAVEKMEV